MSQDSLEDERAEVLEEHSDAFREERAKRKRELFDSIENDSKRLPPSKRKRSYILPNSPTDSDEREKIIIPESTNTTELQPVSSSVPIEQIQAENINSEKNEKSEQKNQPRRSSRKKNTVKLNKVSIVSEGSV